MPYPFISIKCESKILLHEKTPQQFLWGFLVSIIYLEGLFDLHFRFHFMKQKFFSIAAVVMNHRMLNLDGRMFDSVFFV
jgi:hypothetical protein